ncbi:MAG: hypothetical protein IKE21_07195 [Erysipelotrichaceae bacterium]|nr:hypothetical protein [Erysipelotrichaceae bacterium]
MNISQREKVAYRLLDNALRRDRLAQCYLFTGRRSQLKKETALQFAAAILKGEKGWNEDEEFYERLKSGSNYDLHQLNGYAAPLRTEEVEELLSELTLTALEEGSGRKVYLLDGIENASLKVYNQILKFIEETPGSTTYGILLCEDADSLLPTIVSRCEKIPFVSDGREESEAHYREDGFDEEEAYLLSAVFPLYQHLELDDPAYLSARDLLNVTLEHLSEREHLPYWLSTYYYPALSGKRKAETKEDEEEKRPAVSQLKMSEMIYLEMMLKMLEDALNGGALPERSYQQKLALLRANRPEELLAVYRRIRERSYTNTDGRFLFDALAYELINTGKE